MSRRSTLTPELLDSLSNAQLRDPFTPGLAIVAGPSGKRTWRYRRRLGSNDVVRLTLGRYPQHSIAGAREWTAGLNRTIEAGLDPRDVAGAEANAAQMTVAFAHERYMVAVREGRASRAKRRNKLRTITDKLAIYQCDVGPKLGDMNVFDVSENDLTRLILAKGRHAPIRANRLAAELKVFFGWASSLRGTEIGLSRSGTPVASCAAASRPLRSSPDRTTT